MKAVCMVAGAAQREAQWVRQTAKAGAGQALRSPNTTFPPAGASGRPTQRGGGGGGGRGPRTQTPTGRRRVARRRQRAAVSANDEEAEEKRNPDQSKWSVH